MPTYGKENFKESNVNYLNKDFTALKTSLMNYAKSYFPNTYRDFNETSPGMMLLEMNAYVGDVLSFYIDQQYREMLLPLAEERRNVINLAKMFGYKVKPIVPAYVDLTFTANVNAKSGNPSEVDYSDAGIFSSGILVGSSTNTELFFTTLEPIDFTIEKEGDTSTVASVDNAGIATTYTLTRTVRAISATEKQISFQIGVPEKFKTLTIPDTNVIDIISCIDTNNNKWYEVDFLAQDKVPIETHYTETDRVSSYVDFEGNVSEQSVPFSLTYIDSPKRFTRETNEDNTTSLVFGNGVLNNGIDGTIDQGYIDLEQIGIVIPGQTNDLNDSIDPLLGNEYSTLGEAPNNTNLTFTYRIGGGIEANVPADDLTTLPSTINVIGGNTSAGLSTVTNNQPARGGKNEEDTLEIREKAKAFFTTQNRCVTKEDYEARILNIPAKFGNIAKVYVDRYIPPSSDSEGLSIQTINASITGLNSDALNQTQLIQDLIESNPLEEIDDIQDFLDTIDNMAGNTINHLDNQGNYVNALNQYTQEFILNDPPSVNIYILGLDGTGRLVGNRHFPSNGLPNILKTNIKNYLENFKILTDSIIINDGYIVNFGVIFDVIAEKYADKQLVKINCIQKIKEYFNINKMQFNQPIYKSQLEFELMGVEGVRSIGHITITQHDDYHYNSTDGAILPEKTFQYSFSTNQDLSVDIDGDNVNDGQFTTEGGTAGYGFKYNFANALSDDGTIIVPPNVATPTVFELKNPNQNIQGRVR